MRIALLASRPSPSYEFYLDSMELINHIRGHSFQPLLVTDKINYNDFDIALFMGGANDAIRAKSINSSIVCGVVDPRKLDKVQFAGIDILIANSIESQIFFGSLIDETIVYPVYPLVPDGKGLSRYKKGDELIIGYHGNKIHLESLFPRITMSMHKLHKSIPIKLLAMYDLSTLGTSNIINSEKLGFPVESIQYSKDNYYKFMSACDIGIVPQYLSTWLERCFSSIYKILSRDQVNYLTSYKSTTNLGRHFVFCQYKVPVVTDLSPSSSMFFNHNLNGMLSYSSESWYKSLKILASDDVHRRLVGDNGFIKWKNEYSHDVLNIKLIDKLEGMLL